MDMGVRSAIPHIIIVVAFFLIMMSFGPQNLNYSNVRAEYIRLDYIDSISMFWIWNFTAITTYEIKLGFDPIGFYDCNIIERSLKPIHSAWQPFRKFKKVSWQFRKRTWIFTKRYSKCMTWSRKCTDGNWKFKKWSW